MGKILYANDLWFQGGSLLLNNGVFVLVTCLSNWLTTFWTGMVKTSVFDYGKPSPKAIDS